MHTTYYYTSGGWAGFKLSALHKSGKRFFPVSLQRREYGTFPTYFFLEMIYISLKEGWFICRGHKCRCELFIYLFISSNIFTLGSVSTVFYCVKVVYVLKSNTGKRFLVEVGSPNQYWDRFYRFPRPVLGKGSIGSPVQYWEKF